MTQEQIKQAYASKNYRTVMAEYALFTTGEKRGDRTDEDIIAELGGDIGWLMVADFEDGRILTYSMDWAINGFVIINANRFEDSFSAEPLREVDITIKA